jgi:hypothetical protein
VKEKWRPCLGGFYEASSLGRVRRRLPPRAGREISRSTDGGGYLKVSVCVHGSEMTRSVHSLVAEAFIGKRPAGKHVNHKDGNKANNRPCNLEYVTPAVNAAHAAKMGLVASGDRHGRYTKPHRTARGTRVNTAKLNEKQVRKLRRLRERGAPLSELMSESGLSKSACWSIVTRKSWRHVA